MTRRVYLYFVATIVLGAVLGGAGTYYFLWSSGRLTRPGGFHKETAVEHLKKVLNLTDDQTQQLGQIFDASSKKVQDLHKQTDPQFEMIHQETRAHIRQILNADQAKTFDDLVRAIDERHKRRSPPPPS